MKKDKTEIICILDRSGSMSSIQDDAIGGFNSMVSSQIDTLKVEDECLVSVYLFDDRFETVYESVSVGDVEPLTNLTFVPRGMTAMYDAIGRTINMVGSRLAQTEESERPENVLVVVVTDGAENASKEFTGPQVGDMIKHQQDVYNWQFVFLAANIDTSQVAHELNLDSGNTLSYNSTSKGTRDMYDSLSHTVGRVRRGGKATFDSSEEE